MFAENETYDFRLINNGIGFIINWKESVKEKNIMKNIFKHVLRFFIFIVRTLGKVSYYLFSLGLSNKITYLFNVFYSGRISRALRYCGKNTHISYPLYVFGPKNISIGDNFITYARLRIETHERFLGKEFSPNLTIGNNVAINFDCHIGCINKISIGNNVLIASKVFITDHYHGDTTREMIALPPSLRNLTSKGPVIIEDNVWIGEGVTIMPNVTIGENSIIGANSVVTKSVPKNCVAAGVPAAIIKEM